jgi:hypothetical protein
MRAQMANHTPSPPSSGWSNRILTAALAGILFLTLFPFRFAFHANLARHASPFLLGGSGKDASGYDNFLNILLFVPFGFGLSEKLRERGKSGVATLALVLTSGALLSYVIEFLQIYIPPRDSGWQDVLTNATGSVAGFCLYELAGCWAIRLLSLGDERLTAWLRPARAVWVVLVYFALWFTLSIPLQKNTRLSNWASDSLLVVGNDAPGRLPAAWRGRVFRLQLWDRALRHELAEKLTAGETPEAAQSGLVGAYDFRTPPFEDEMRSLPDLSWTESAAIETDRREAILDGSSWLSSGIPVSNLVADFEKTNQFTIRVACAPKETVGVDGRIISISRRSGLVDMQIRQEAADLVLWFRTPLSVTHSRLAWYIPNVFAVDQMRDILFTYDGSDLSLFVDGGQNAHSYHLGPGTGLARVFRAVKPAELDGYNDIYYALVFFPGGILVGMAARRLDRSSSTGPALVALGCLLPPLILEFILIRVSGRPISFRYIALSAFFSFAGILWTGADHKKRATHIPLSAAKI